MMLDVARQGLLARVEACLVPDHHRERFELGDVVSFGFDAWAVAFFAGSKSCLGLLAVRTRRRVEEHHAKGRCLSHPLSDDRA